MSVVEVECLVEYHPYWIYTFEEKIKNPAFDNNSRNILNLKNGYEEAITYFANLLVKQFDKKWENCYCMEVPSHDPTNTSNPMQKVIKKIIEEIGSIYNLKDCSGSLIRHKEISKLSTGGNRSIDVHLNSIKLSDKTNISGKNILLLDDVATTGNSLIACYQILVAKGANNVFPVALAQTVR